MAGDPNPVMWSVGNDNDGLHSQHWISITQLDLLTFVAVGEEESSSSLAVGEVVNHHARVLGDATTKHTHPGRWREMVMLRLGVGTSWDWEDESWKTDRVYDVSKRLTFRNSEGIGVKVSRHDCKTSTLIGHDHIENDVLKFGTGSIDHLHHGLL